MLSSSQFIFGRKVHEKSKSTSSSCGYGAVTPHGNESPTDDTLWTALINGETAIRPLPFDPVPLHIDARVASWMPETFNIRDYTEIIPYHSLISNPKLWRSDLSIQLGMAAAALACHGSGLLQARPGRIGVQGATGLGGGRSHEDGYRSFLDMGSTNKIAFVVQNVMPNAIAGVASIGFGLHGPSSVTSAACASGNYAIYEAVAKIRAGMVDAMLVIGTESMASAFMTGAFDALKALSHTNSANASRPFCSERDGFVMGEAGATLILAELGWAEAHHLPILAEIMGVGANSGARDIVQPNAEWAAECMDDALEDASLCSAQIDYVNTHGTSTPLGDKAEAEALWKVFVADIPYVKRPELPTINSTKALLGHTLGAAGVLELIVCLLSIRDNRTHPMGDYDLDSACLRPYGQEDPHDRFDSTLPICLAGTTDRTINTALSNGFGFGDHNAVIILGRA